jgi:hypothetical protein
MEFSGRFHCAGLKKLSVSTLGHRAIRFSVTERTVKVEIDGGVPLFPLKLRHYCSLPYPPKQWLLSFLGTKKPIDKLREAFAELGGRIVT